VTALANVVVVRHGETEWSRSGRHTGRTDLDLTEEGRRQARMLRPRLAGEHFDLVLVSPLRRAMETARLAGVTDVVADDDLVEWDYGDYEGRTTDEILQDRPGWDLFRDGAPNGETAADVGIRADRAIEAIRATSGGRVLVVAHGHLLRVLSARWVGMAPADGHVLGTLGAASVSALDRERATAVVRLWNDTSHLAG
jgi:broad specificity phosphatase PhoE